MAHYTNKEHTTVSHNNSSGRKEDLIRLGYMSEDESIADYQPPVIPIQEVIDTQFNNTVSPLVNSIPELERASWTTQEREAREWLADNTASVPFIETLAAVRGVELSVLVEKILAKADAYSLALATALGEKQKAEDENN